MAIKKRSGQLAGFADVFDGEPLAEPSDVSVN